MTTLGTRVTLFITGENKAVISEIYLVAVDEMILNVHNVIPIINKTRMRLHMTAKSL